MKQPPEILLYTRPGCHLCEDVKELLQRAARRFPHRLREVDISGDRDLQLRYGFTIPVLRSGELELAAPIDEEILLPFLEELTRGQ